VVSIDDVTNGKPDPEGFRRALEAMLALGSMPQPRRADGP
jgi:beta-phosphoglucomutase-like phosphatase (HAD superfamily)